MRAKLNAEMEAKLKETGLGFEKINVFGAVRLNIHVTCMSLMTANKWVQVLSKVAGKPATLTKHTWNAQIQKGTVLLPTLRHGYLIAVVGA